MVYGRQSRSGLRDGCANSRYAWAACCKQYDADNSAKGCGSAANNALCYAVSLPVGEPHAKMYANINEGWPIDSWELTEPSLGYQTAYIRLISRFVKQKGVDIGEKFGSGSTDAVKPVAAPVPNLNVALAGNSLEAVSSADIREIRLFDVNNRETLRWNGNARRVSLDISALKPGVYAVRAVSGAKTVTRLVLRR